jgi:hypothetical protein
VAGPESDAYSLALTLFECWAGENPVAADTPAETARRIGQPQPGLGDYRPDLPRALVDAVDACLEPETERRATPAELAEELEAAMPMLDDQRFVPGPASEQPEALGTRLGLGRIAGLLALVGCLAVVAGPIGAPGLALVLAALVVPAAFLVPACAAATTPAGGLLGAMGLAGASPALAGAVATSPASRAVAGSLAWCWAVVAAVALGAGPRLGIAPRAADGWERDAGEAAASVLAPLVEPAALLGLGIFALAAVAMGWILSARYLPVAALGGLLWAAGLGAALRLVGDGELGERPLLLALAAATALAVEHVRRAPRPARSLAASRDRRISFP